MPTWVWIVMLAALIKLPIAALMLWIPFRNDEAMRETDASDSSEEDGGSHALPGAPLSTARDRRFERQFISWILGRALVRTC